MISILDPNITVILEHSCNLTTPQSAQDRSFIFQDNENPLQPGVFTFHANDALNVAIRPDANPGWGNAANTEWNNEIITGSGDNNQVVANNQEWNTDQWANQQNPVRIHSLNSKNLVSFRLLFSVYSAF